MAQQEYDRKHSPHLVSPHFVVKRLQFSEVKQAHITSIYEQLSFCPVFNK